MHLPPRHAKPVLSGGSLLELTSSLNYFPPLAIQILPVSHTRPTHSTSTGSSSQQCCLSVIHTANNFRVFIMSQVDSTTVTAHECRDGQRACFLAPIPPRILQSLSFFFFLNGASMISSCYSFPHFFGRPHRMLLCLNNFLFPLFPCCP